MALAPAVNALMPQPATPARQPLGAVSPPWTTFTFSAPTATSLGPLVRTPQSLCSLEPEGDVEALDALT
jgi:hypothetical protein